MAVRELFSVLSDYIPHKVMTDTGCPQWKMVLIRSIVCEHSSQLGLML